MKKIYTSILLLAISVCAVFAFTGCKSEPVDGRYSAVAQCLTEKGVKFYGSYTCGHCAIQKEMFGDDFRYIDSYECHPRGQNADPEACAEAGVQAYPSWFFPGQELITGRRPIEELAKKANCEEFLPGAQDEQPAESTAESDNQ